MYYTVNARTGLIMESSDTCPDQQEEADCFGDPVYIIRGQHTGLTAEPSTPEPTPTELEVDTLKKLAAWEAQG